MPRGVPNPKPTDTRLERWPGFPHPDEVPVGHIHGTSDNRHYRLTEDGEWVELRRNDDGTWSA